MTAVIRGRRRRINLEDSGAPDGGLFHPAAQAARIRAARTAAADAGLPELVINARTDVFLFGIGEPAGRLDDVLARAVAYAEASADSLFVPGLLDLGTFATLTGGIALPVTSWSVPERRTTPHRCGRASAGKPWPGDVSGRDTVVRKAAAKASAPEPLTRSPVPTRSAR